MDWLDLTGVDWPSMVRGLVWLVVGISAATIAGRLAYRAAEGRSSRGSQLLLKRTFFYGILTVSVLSALRQWGLELDVLLGAAGILTVAIGFASQTSASNLISGAFLLAEGAFKVGDTIQVDDVTGEVLSVDLLSAKIRTFDNRYVRMPNETLIKSKVINLSHYPIRRAETVVRVPFSADFDAVSAIIYEALRRDCDVLDEPEPRLWTMEYGDTWTNIRVTFWAIREQYFDVKDRVPLLLVRALAEASIEMPPPTRVEIRPVP